ncbi:Uma2 family endonuclease [bacterium]|nr:Uma2 family endonuclease [bacterium]
MEDGDAYELDDGELVEVPGGFESQDVAGELLRRLGNFLEGRSMGRVVPMELGLQIFPDRPRRIPRPDGGFISFERLGSTRAPTGFLTQPPELVIEAVSPGDLASYLDRKVQEYLSADVQLVWVLLPDTRRATVYRADGSVTLVHPNGYLDGEDVLPGFRCALADIMPPDEDETGES